MTLNDIQDLHDALPIYGGTIELPAEHIEGSTGVVITKSNVSIVGKGMNMNDAQEANTAAPYRAPTQIKYTGTGVAIQIGTSTQTATTLGTEIKNLSIRGTNNAIAGVRVESNTSNGVVSGRILIENVDVRDFKNSTWGVGVDLHYGISVTLRRVHVHNNNRGIWPRWGNDYVFDGIIARHNLQGIRASAFDGLWIGGGSVIESNDYQGFILSMEDHCYRLTLADTWLENNNVISSGVNDAIFIQPDVSGTYLNGLTLRNVKFNGGRGNIGYTNVNSIRYENITWNTGVFYS